MKTREPSGRARRPAEPARGRRAPALAVLAVVAAAIALFACGCGRKAKPEPLWGAARVPAITITERSR